MGHDVHQGVQHGTGLEHDVEHHGFVDDQFRRIAIFFAVDAIVVDFQLLFDTALSRCNLNTVLFVLVGQESGVRV